MSPDPAGMGSVDPAYPQSWNLYDYALDNPSNNIDPLGLFAPAPPPPPGPPPAPPDDTNPANCAPLCGSPFPQFSLNLGNLFSLAVKNFLAAQKKKACSQLPKGRVYGVNGGLGGIGGVSASAELLVNYVSGQISTFVSGGVAVGWQAGAQFSVFNGYVYGNLSPDNSNFSGGFSTVYASFGAGSFISSSSGDSPTGSHPWCRTAISQSMGPAWARVFCRLPPVVLLLRTIPPPNNCRPGLFALLQPDDMAAIVAQQACKL